MRENGAAGWWRAGLVVLLVAGLWLVLLLSLPPFAGLVVGVAFVFLLLPYFLPTTYIIAPEGVRVQRGIVGSRLKPWSAFAHFRETERGYWLVPANLDTMGRIAPLRAVFLPYPLEPKLRTLLEMELAHYFPVGNSE